uniref:Uncharacterized protein n=1 Tax=viral metagenome TaxID=1070528 RepID=A0A6C0D6V2_9ZZZZ
MSLLNQCISIKSQKHSNIKCTSKAVSEGFCSKHCKKRIVFVYSQKEQQSVIKIQNTWKKYCLRNYSSRQGPARNDFSLANNNSDIYSLEELNTIPNIYFFSFHDSNKHIWAFDIRTLSYLCSKSKSTKNPYTQEILSTQILNKINKRFIWLKEHKYSLTYDNPSLTNEQMWNQKVLDVFSLMEGLGYLFNSDWFHEMEKEDHIIFYKKLYDLWNYRLQLSIQEKNLIVPGFNRKKLFKFLFEELEEKEEKVLKKMNLQIIELFLSSKNALGAMYVLMGLSYVNDSITETYPWIHTSLS